MHITVMKFGGTSVANAEAIGRVVAIVKAEIERGRAPAVVVSAMSGVTDRLFEVSRAAVAGDRDVVERALSELRQRDMTAVDALVPEADAAPLRTKVDEHFDALRAVLTAVSILREAPPRSLDEIASRGRDDSCW